MPIVLDLDMASREVFRKDERENEFRGIGRLYEEKPEIETGLSAFDNRAGEENECEDEYDKTVERDDDRSATQKRVVRKAGNEKCHYGDDDPDDLLFEVCILDGE